MRKKESSLIINFRKLVMMPLLFLCACILIITSVIMYDSLASETEEGLKNLAHSFYRTVSSAEGDFHFDNGILMKGEERLSNRFSLVNEIYEVSGIDATLFWKDERVLTTIRNPDGKLAVGTKAAEEVSLAVLNQGREYFSSSVHANNVPYFGYYMPLSNQDGSVAGMLFVGKPRYQVMNTIIQEVFIILVVMLGILAAATGVAMHYASKIVVSLTEIKDFLRSVAHGNSQAQLDEAILNRRDEIGQMGHFSLMLQKFINEQVSTDPLTGLHNRRSCSMFLEGELREYREKGIPFAVAIGDIDDFKKINDSYGHQAGDEVLKSLARLFEEQMGRKGAAARWGGEEFLFIYHRTSRSQALVYLDAMKKAVDNTIFDADGNSIHVTMTFGVSECSEAECIEDLLRTADTRLYAGKETGKNKVI